MDLKFANEKFVDLHSRQLLDGRYTESIFAICRYLFNEISDNAHPVPRCEQYDAEVELLLLAGVDIIISNETEPDPLTSEDDDFVKAFALGMKCQENGFDSKVYYLQLNTCTGYFVSTDRCVHNIVRNLACAAFDIPKV